MSSWTRGTKAALLTLLIMACAGEEGEALTGVLVDAGAGAHPDASYGEMAPGSADATTPNRPPEVAAAYITPPGAKAGEPLACETAGVEDPDGDEVRLAYRWTANGEQIPDATEKVLDTAGMNRGDSVRCVVTPGDGKIQGMPEKSGPVVLGNRPPLVEKAELDPPVGDRRTIFECTAIGLEDPDGDPALGIYEWLADGEIIEGAGGASFTAGDLEAGDVLACRVTPFDGEISGMPVTSVGALISNSPPVVRSVLVQGSDPADLRCVAYDVEDPDGDNVELTVAWYVDDEPIDEAQEERYDASDLARGSELSCSVTPRDAEAEGAATYSKNAFVAPNHPPGKPGVRIEPTDPQTGERLSCTVEEKSVDPDGDEVSYTTTWQLRSVDGELPSEPKTADGEELPAGTTKAGETWSCVVTPNDGEADGPEGFDTVTILGPRCLTEDDYTVSLWPTGAPEPECSNSSGTVLPQVGEGAVNWFNYGGCGGWKEFDVDPGRKYLLQAYGDSCGGCVLWHISFDISEDLGSGLEITGSHDPEPDQRGMRYSTYYVPQTSLIRISTSDGFYLRVKACPGG
jgi:hypothetical protein